MLDQVEQVIQVNGTVRIDVRGKEIYRDRFIHCEISCEQLDVKRIDSLVAVHVAVADNTRAVFADKRCTVCECRCGELCEHRNQQCDRKHRAHYLKPLSFQMHVSVSSLSCSSG